MYNLTITYKNGNTLILNRVEHHRIENGYLQVLQNSVLTNSGLIEFDGYCRYLTRRELEQGQTLPIGYTDILTYNQMQDVVGDAWTVDVIAHIFSYIK